ncbi:hypothetical protein KBC31_02210 [Candidatus Saccharibacteria bacterium]|jgi:hypothetical protein|nr:hypothetical protein [Candidatus Saccharibacteria bacterium]
MGPNQQYPSYTPPTNYGGGKKGVTIDKQMILYIGLAIALILGAIMMFASLGKRTPATAAIDTTIAKEEELLRINDIAKNNVGSEYEAAIIHANSVTMTQTSIRQLYAYRSELTKLPKLDETIVAQNTNLELDADFEKAISVNRFKQVYKATMEKQLNGNLANHKDLFTSTGNEKLKAILVQTIANEEDLLAQVQKL